MASAALTAPPRSRARASRRLVRRPRLVGALSSPDAPPLIVIVAPAGYGKTVLLQEWCDRDRRPSAWIGLSERDNDAERLEELLWTTLARAAGRPCAIAVDDVQALHEPPAREVLAAAADALPPDTTLALASRRPPPLPLARRRAEGSVLEIRPADLAMTRGEANALLRLAGPELGREQVSALMRRTEGWPAALSLAATSMTAHGGAAALAGFSGADRHVAEYGREEILHELEPAERELVLCAAVLDTLSGPACDALLERSGSAKTLTELARGSVPLVALDRAGEQWRFNRLFGEMLRAELKRLEPGLEPVLHGRASAWYAQAGEVDRAVRHALEAGDACAAGRLVCDAAGTAIVHGRNPIVQRWLGWFTEAQIRADGGLALVAVASELAMGRGHIADHWRMAAGTATRPRASAAGRALARAALARDEDLAAMGTHARHAAGAMAADSPWRAVPCLLAGMSARLTGAADAAGEWLGEAALRAAVPAPGLHAAALGQLALLALDRDDWETAASLVVRARAQVDRYGLDRQAPTALILAVSALVRAHRGRVEDAQADREDAIGLAELIVEFPAWYEAELEIVLGRVALRLGEPQEARDRLRRATRAIAGLPETPALHESLRRAVETLAAFGQPAAPGTPALTTAELRILRQLPTHLSFREIAEGTYVSANTVKTQANAVYRKLDVSCRSEAVSRARALGLLGD